MFLQGAKDFGLFGASKSGDASGPSQQGGAVPGKAKQPRTGATKKGLKKQTGAKISILGNKLTDLKVLKNKVSSAPLSLGHMFG